MKLCEIMLRGKTRRKHKKFQGWEKVGNKDASDLGRALIKN